MLIPDPECWSILWCFLLLAFLINRCTKSAVRLVFDRLEKCMGTYEFASIFQYILTDPGSESNGPDALETSANGIQCTSTYYRDLQSGQKKGSEQTHTMLRMVLPKWTGSEFLTQWDVNLAVNQINSTLGEILDGKIPYQKALKTLGRETLKAFQLKLIELDRIILTPKLICLSH